MRAVVGIDLGGTLVRAGALDPEGQLLAWAETPIEAARGPAAGVQRITGLVHDILRQIGAVQLLGIGIGSTGPVDRQLGAIQNPHTLPTWENVDVVSPLQDHFGVPVTLENDADAAALGEYWRGAGGGLDRLVMVTVGTGIGAAFVYRGEIYRGVQGHHPETGHNIIDASGPPCYCGACGCWESLASGPAIARRAQEAVLEAATPTSLLARAGGDVTAIDARLVAEAAAGGDLLARQVIAESARYLALGLVNVIQFLLPQRIILGGGVMRSYELFRPVVESVITQHNVMAPTHLVEMRPALLGQQAGVVGAGYAVYQLLQGEK